MSDASFVKRLNPETRYASRHSSSAGFVLRDRKGFFYRQAENQIGIRFSPAEPQRIRSQIKSKYFNPLKTSVLLVEIRYDILANTSLVEAVPADFRRQTEPYKSNCFSIGWFVLFLNDC
jgi:hypothetical protein